MRKIVLFAFMLIAVVLLAACGTNAGLEARNEALGDTERNITEGNFQEAQQIDAVEAWKDQEGKIVNLYILNPVTGGLLVDPIQCIGVPNSSTESLEPNRGTRYSGAFWRVPVDGLDIYTDEIPGKDGTFGDPVHFRYCLGVDGNYFDFPAYSLPYLVTSASFTFEPATVKRDFEGEARLLVAEEILKRGGCIDPTTLVEIDCQ